FHDTVDTNESYVTFVVGDGGKVYQVGRPGQVSWGAGRVANHNAPVQIELGRTYNSGQFWQDYVTYVRVARAMAGKYSIPVALERSEERRVGKEWRSQDRKDNVRE